MAVPTLCLSCGRNTEPGTPLFVGRRRLEDGSYLCDDCARAGKEPGESGSVPITMPNANFPNTH